MRESLWARSREKPDGVTAEWHAILDRARMTTICGVTIVPPYETRADAPGFRETACAQCFSRATDLIGIEETARDPIGGVQDPAPPRAGGGTQDSILLAASAAQRASPGRE